MLDGNRRWARELGQTASFGHRKGADKISEFLGWCDEVGIQVVTLWLLSTDNLKRSAEEIGQLAEIIAGAVETLAASGYWRLRMVGNLDMLPESLSRRLRAPQAAPAEARGAGGTARRRTGEVTGHRGHGGGHGDGLRRLCRVAHHRASPPTA